MPPTFPFDGQVVLVTGASSGLGREAALQLAAPSVRLVLVGRDAARLQAVGADCSRRGAAVRSVVADLSVEGDCQRVVDDAVATFGGLDVLFCAAGQAMKGGFAGADSPRATVELMRVNFDSVVFLCHRALPHLLKRQGRIAVVAGLLGHVGVPGYTAYAASKHAVVGFCRALRRELSARGVSVTLISPDTVRTSVRAHLRDASGRPAPEGYGDEPAMDPAACAQAAIAATVRRAPECVFGRVRVMAVLQALLPGVLDRLLAKALKAAARARPPPAVP